MKRGLSDYLRYGSLGRGVVPEYQSPPSPIGDELQSADESHTVMVNKVDNGVVVKVGCKTLAFSYREEGQFIHDMREYLFGDAKKMVQKYNK